MNLSPEAAAAVAALSTTLVSEAAKAGFAAPADEAALFFARADIKIREGKATFTVKDKDGAPVSYPDAAAYVAARAAAAPHLLCAPVESARDARRNFLKGAR